MTPFVICDCCQGTGKVRLSREMRATYDVLAAIQPARALDIWIIDDPDLGEVKLTAINNRLVKLQRHGLATRVKKGREYFWTTT